MAARLREHATYEDLVKVPETMVAELIEGELFASPRPGWPHARASSMLGGVLVPPFSFGNNGPGGWWIIDEPELHFRHNVLVPDLAGWRREHMPEPPKNHIFTVVPDWVCEVTSPSNGRIDRFKKLPIYAREGIANAWLIDPEQQVLEAYRNADARWILDATYGENQIVRVAPFDAIEIDLTLIWGPPPA
jgi:Uma2 family endonuclease